MGEEIAITFETLYDLLMREKQREELLQLEPSFYQDVISYLQEKMRAWERIKQETDLFSLGERDKIEAELKNIRKVLKDLYEKREKKIIDTALNKSRVGHALDATNLLDEERKFFDSIVNVMDRFRKGVLLNLFKMEMPNVSAEVLGVSIDEKKEIKQKETRMIRFLHAVPKFVGSDLAIYGPFDENDVGNLPKDVSQVLINKKRAEEIKKE